MQCVIVAFPDHTPHRDHFDIDFQDKACFMKKINGGWYTLAWINAKLIFT